MNLSQMNSGQFSTNRDEAFDVVGEIISHTPDMSPDCDYIDTDLSLMRRLEDEARSYGKLGLLSETSPDLITDWRNRLDTQPKRFINRDFSINQEALRNFRRLQIMVGDLPNQDNRNFSLKSIVGEGAAASDGCCESA